MTYNSIVGNIESVMHIAGQSGNKSIQLTSTIQKELYTSELSRAYQGTIDNFDNISTQSTSGEIPKILLEVPKNLNITVGDTIKFESKIQPLFSGSIDGFEKYSFFQNVGGRVSVGQFEIQKATQGNVLSTIQKWTRDYIYAGFPRDIAGIILGMTIGDVTLMSSSTQDNFRASGISHILVVSGSNITFLILLLSGILRYFTLKKGIRIGIIFVFVLLYSSLVGWDVPVVRSTIMGLIGFFAIEQGKRLSSLAILLLVADGYLLYSPLSLIYDPGFGLSFGATASIILFYTDIHKKLQSWKIHTAISSILSITTAASIGTLPISLYHFGTLSYGFFFANIAISFIVGWILFASVLYILGGFLGSTFLYYFGITIYIPVVYITSIAEIFGSWGYITIETGIQLPIVILCITFLCSHIIKLDHLLQVQVKKEHHDQ